MKRTFFSIVIPTYNRAELLKRCLDSVEAQTYQNWEAIVVDNYSEDNTEEIVSSFQDPRIKYVKNHNYGVIAVSRNKALDLAKGDWVAFLDSDDCWLPNKLEYVLPFLEDYDLVYHGYRQNIPKTRIFQRRERYFYEIKEVNVSYVIQRGDPINPSCTCVRRDAIGDTRFSEEKDLIAVEDYDFFLQLIAKRIRIKYLKVVLTLYDVSGCSHSEKASERDAVLFNKWKPYLDEDGWKAVEYQYKRRKADYLLSAGKYKEARKLYKELLGSPIGDTRMRGIKGYIKCLLCFKSL